MGVGMLDDACRLAISVPPEVDTVKEPGVRIRGFRGVAPPEKSMPNGTMFRLGLNTESAVVVPDGPVKDIEGPVSRILLVLSEPGKAALPLNRSPAAVDIVPVPAGGKETDGMNADRVPSSSEAMDAAQ